ncbi:hypothetical protein AB3S75_039851 [Citrus x aurantiifolia]
MSMKSVLWEEDGSLVYFKGPLASGAKLEDVKVGTEGGKLLITSTVACLRPLSSSPLIISKEGDGKMISMKFNLPAGVNPNGFETSMDDDAGVLTVTFKKLVPVLSCAAERPFNFDNSLMGWDEPVNEESKGVVHFKANLAGGTKREDLIVGILGGKMLIIGQQLQENEGGDDCSLGKNCKSFILPPAVNPNGFETLMDDAGVLTVTFKELKPEKKKKKKKLVSKLKWLGCLAQGCLLAGSKLAFDEVVGDDN